MRGINKVILIGKLRHREHEDKDGQKKYVAEIVADQLILLDKKAKYNRNEENENTDGPPPF